MKEVFYTLTADDAVTLGHRHAIRYDGRAESFKVACETVTGMSREGKITHTDAARLLYEIEMHAARQATAELEQIKKANG